MLNTLLQSIVQKLSNNILLLFITGLTVTTSGVAGNKIYKEYIAVKSPNIASIKSTVNSDKKIESSTETENSLANLVDNTSKQANNDSLDVQPASDTNNTSQVNENNSNQQISFPTATNTKSNKNASSSANLNLQKASCIVSIFGKNYDVQPLRRTHSGGDIFTCDTDMSTTYKNQHGTNVNRLKKYLTNANIGSSNPQAPAEINPGNNSNNSFEKEEEHEDKEYEEEYKNYYRDGQEDEKSEKNENEIEEED